MPVATPTTSIDLNSSHNESHIQYLTRYIEQITTERDELSNLFSQKIALEKQRFFTQQKVRETEFEKELISKDAENKGLKQRIHTLSEQIKEYRKEIKALEESNQRTDQLEGKINFQKIIIDILQAQLKHAYSDLDALQALFEEATLELSQIKDADITSRITGHIEQNESHISQLDQFMTEIDELDEEAVLGKSPIMPEKSYLAQELEEAGDFLLSPNPERLERYNAVALQDYIVHHSEQYPAILVSFLLQIVWKQVEDTSIIEYETEFYNSETHPLKTPLNLDTNIWLPKRWVEDVPEADPSEIASIESLYTPLEFNANQNIHTAPGITIKKYTQTDYSFRINPVESPSAFFHSAPSEKQLPNAQIIAHMLIALAYRQHDNLDEGFALDEEDTTLKVTINEAHPCAQELVDFLCAYQSLSVRLGKPIPLSITNSPHSTRLSDTNPEKIDKLLTQLLPDTLQNMLLSNHSATHASFSISA